MATPDADKIVQAIERLTDQTARLAWAVECVTLRIDTPIDDAPCRRCGSQLVLEADDQCRACLHQKAKEQDA